jgi:hypothetical protein
MYINQSIKSFSVGIAAMVQRRSEEKINETRNDPESAPQR